MWFHKNFKQTCLLCFCIYIFVCVISAFSVMKLRQTVEETILNHLPTTTTSADSKQVFNYPSTTGPVEEIDEDSSNNNNNDEDDINWQTIAIQVPAGDTKNQHTTSLLIKCETCAENVLCVPPIQCPAHVRMQEHEKPRICDLPGESNGLCCMTGQNHTADNSAGFAPRRLLPFVHDMPLALVEQSFRRFEALMHNVPLLPVRRGQPDFMHGIFFHSPGRDDRQHFHASNTAMQQIIAGQLLAKKEEIPVDDLITNNVQVNWKKTPLSHHCPAAIRCADAHFRYRTLDGTCNNPLRQRARWGSAGEAMERLLPPAYEDGIWAARVHAVDGTELMGAREISRRLMTDVNAPHPKYNLLLMQFGQFLAHDIVQSAAVVLENGASVECCTANGAHALPENRRHFACMPITVPHDDEFFGVFNVRCLNFVRLSLVPNAECKMGYGKQRNKVTHFIDASTVYGSSEETTRELREFNGGRLRMSKDFGRDLLPMASDGKSCEASDASRTCYKSGDGRTNVIISLTILHLLFSREHNRIAGILAAQNPRLRDETLFQEARRIVIAELQHIVYNEYLPAIIGPQQMQRFRLTPQKQGYANGYSVDVNPSITNEFSAAAFRMGHSSVYGSFHVYRQDHEVEEIINIPDVMFNPSRMRTRSFYDNMLRSMYTQPMQRVDRFITHGLSRYLFRGDNPFGLDLAAFNIQRGRDHALRSYNDYLEVMGHKKLRNFADLPDEIGRQLAQIYHSPDDIDLWVGGLFESPVKDGCVGGTFSEIIADQFARLKHGDRYFYEYGSDINPGAFTAEQLQEIRKASMARLICDNADHLNLVNVPPAAFVQVDLPLNKPVSCDSSQIPVVNLAAWRGRLPE